MKKGSCLPLIVLSLSLLFELSTHVHVLIFYFCTVYRVYLGLGSGVMGPSLFFSLYFFMWGKTL